MTPLANLPALTGPELDQLHAAIESRIAALRLELQTVRSAGVAELPEILAERVQVCLSLRTAIAEAHHTV